MVCAQMMLLCRLPWEAGTVPAAEIPTTGFPVTPAGISSSAFSNPTNPSSGAYFPLLGECTPLALSLAGTGATSCSALGVSEQAVAAILLICHKSSTFCHSFPHQPCPGGTARPYQVCLEDQPGAATRYKRRSQLQQAWAAWSAMSRSHPSSTTYCAIHLPDSCWLR